MMPETSVPLLEAAGTFSTMEFRLNVPLVSKTGAVLGSTVIGTTAVFVPIASMAVNVSPEQLRSRSFVASVAASLSRHGVEPSELVLEITESVFADAEHVLTRVREIRELGIRLAIDDFGTGYSSLSYLRDYPVDILKIDRSFISRIGTTTRDDALVRSMLGLAEQFELEVIAEGIETVQQLEFLQELGCDELQGYLLSRPIPSAEFWENPSIMNGLTI